MKNKSIERVKVEKKWKQRKMSPSKTPEVIPPTLSLYLYKNKEAQGPIYDPPPSRNL